MSVFSRTILCVYVLLVVACSTNDDDDYQPAGDHAWKTQTEALDKARNVEQLLQDAAEDKRRAMEQQTQ